LFDDVRKLRASAVRGIPILAQLCGDSGSGNGRRWKAAAFRLKPLAKDRHFFERYVIRRTDEVIRLRGMDCASRYCESAMSDFVADQGPSREREALTRYGRAHDGDRVIEGRA
jgi:hypothetical protein